MKKCLAIIKVYIHPSASFTRERLWKPLISLQLLQDKEKIGTKLAKPKMRGLLAAQTRRHVLTGCTLAIASGLAYKHFVADARRAAYAEFYRLVFWEEA